MDTPLNRRRTMVQFGLQPPIPDVATRRAWEFIDDRVPPEGEADGEFRSHLDWIQHAASYIGWTGAKCYDAKNRRCDTGAAFALARDEGAFPVRWYLPERFPPGRPLERRMYDLLTIVNASGDDGVTAEAVSQALTLKTQKSLPFAAAEQAGWIELRSDAWRITPEGAERQRHEKRCLHRAACIRHDR